MDNYEIKTIKNSDNTKTIVGVPGWVDRLQSSEKISGSADAYALVPLVFRAINIRAKALTAIPFHLYNGKKEVEWSKIFATPFKSLLKKTEMSMLLKGAAYWEKIVNNGGSRLVGAQWLNPLTVNVKFEQRDGANGLEQNITFIQHVNGLKDRTFTAEQIAYFREFDLKSDVEPGVSAASVSIADSAFLHYMTTFASNFFETGAQPMTILGVAGNPQGDEMKKLEALFKRAAVGIKNAFGVHAMKADGINITKLTPDLNTLALPENRNQSVENVAWAFEIPITMLTDSANYATAVAQKRSFYEETICPRADDYAEEITRQFLPPGYRLEADPEEMSLFQTDEADRAGSLSQLTDAGVPLELAMEILGYKLDDEQLAKLKAASIDTQPDNKPAQTEPAQQDMNKFLRKALKHVGERVNFESDNIPQDVIDGITSQLESCKSEADVRALFDNARKPDTDISDLVKQLSRANDLLERDFA